MAPGLLDSKIPGLQTLEHVMRVSRTRDSIVSLLPKGGEAIWGNLDWSPEENCVCGSKKENGLRDFVTKSNTTNDKRVFKVQESTNYGRMLSFGKLASELYTSNLPTFDSLVNKTTHFSFFNLISEARILKKLLIFCLMLHRFKNLRS